MIKQERVLKKTKQLSLLTLLLALAAFVAVPVMAAPMINGSFADFILSGDAEIDEPEPTESDLDIVDDTTVLLDMFDGALGTLTGVEFVLHGEILVVEAFVFMQIDLDGGNGGATLGAAAVLNAVVSIDG
jgi:hypothetical protein